jgi:hypothetical protein
MKVAQARDLRYTVLLIVNLSDTFILKLSLAAYLVEE